MSEHVGSGRRQRIFHHFGQWPLVPTEDLQKLRHSLRQVQKIGRPAATGELLDLVERELHRRGQEGREHLSFRAGTGTN